jgi:hypothetical protein
VDCIFVEEMYVHGSRAMRKSEEWVFVEEMYVHGSRAMRKK